MSELDTRVLVVDDEECLRLLLQAVLTDEGFAADTADCGEVAVERLGSSPYDVVLMDNNMPGLSGLDVLAHVRRVLPELPVIIMTAYGSLEVSIRAHELGAAGYLLKPFDDVADIGKEIRHVLDRSIRARAHGAGPVARA